MEMLYAIVLLAHISSSAVGLFALLPPLVAQKGGRVHAVSGRVFVCSMLASSLTGAALAVSSIVAPALFRPGKPSGDARVGGSFLLLIAALTGNAVLVATRALERKRAPAPQAQPSRIGSVIVLALAALASMIVGCARGHVLSIVFGALALWLAARDLDFARRPLPHPRAYLYQHIRAMGTASISAVTAFAVIGGRRLLGDEVLGDRAWLLWVLPGLVLGPLFGRWVRVYRAKLEGAPERLRDVAQASPTDAATRHA